MPGAVLVVTVDGDRTQAWERGWDAEGRVALVATGPAEAEESAVTAYWQRRRERDRDLWVVELIIPEAKRFAAETTGRRLTCCSCTIQVIIHP